MSINNFSFMRLSMLALFFVGFIAGVMLFKAGSIWCLLLVFMSGWAVAKSDFYRHLIEK